MFPIMRPSLRKFALTAHITSSVGWLGAAVGFLAHAIATLSSQDAQVVRTAYALMELTGWFVLVPLSLASLITGVIQSFGTKWGLFRHYWVAAKFVITVFATIILLIFMRGLSNLADIATGTTSAVASGGHHGGAASPVVQAAGGILLLLVAVSLSVYKPWGKTRYGQSKPSPA